MPNGIRGSANFGIRPYGKLHIRPNIGPGSQPLEDEVLNSIEIVDLPDNRVCPGFEAARERFLLLDDGAD